MSDFTNADGGRSRWGRIALRWLPPLLWMGVIFVASHTPSAQIPDAGPWDLLLKKGGHLLSYALLAWLWLRALRPALAPPCLLWAVFAIAALYAISDEYHQTFVPGRNGTPVDALIDAAGALLAIFVWHRRHRHRA